MENVVVVIGAGQIGQAIARRVGVGKHVVLADRSEANANAAADVMINAGYRVSVATVDVASRETVRALVDEATGIGEMSGSFTPLASLPVKRRRRPSCMSISTAPPSCSRSSGR